MRVSRHPSVTEKKRRSTCRQPWTKSASRPAVKPRVNRLSTGRCVPPSEFRLFVLLEKRSGDVSSMPWGVRRTHVSWANSVGVRSCPAPPRRPAVRPDPTRPLNVRVLDSTGSFFGFDKWLSTGTSRTVVLSSLKMWPEGWLVVRRMEVSRQRCPHFGFDKSNHGKQTISVAVHGQSMRASCAIYP